MVASVAANTEPAHIERFLVVIVMSVRLTRHTTTRTCVRTHQSSRLKRNADSHRGPLPLREAFDVPILTLPVLLKMLGPVTLRPLTLGFGSALVLSRELLWIRGTQFPSACQVLLSVTLLITLDAIQLLNTLLFCAYSFAMNGFVFCH
jgi:hypothetical protein